MIHLWETWFRANLKILKYASKVNALKLYFRHINFGRLSRSHRSSFGPSKNYVVKIPHTVRKLLRGAPVGGAIFCRCIGFSPITDHFHFSLLKHHTNKIYQQPYTNILFYISENLIYLEVLPRNWGLEKNGRENSSEKSKVAEKRNLSENLKSDLIFYFF